MTRKILSAAVSAALALGLAGISSRGQASGYSVPELSTAGLSLSNALVANPEELGAIPYNAAAMGFHDKSSLSLGALFINFSLSVDTASGSHDSQSPDWVIPPLFQAVMKINDQWRVGLGVTAPFGLETRWDIGTFPELTGNQPPPRQILPKGNHPTMSKLQVLDFAPTASYKVNENLSVSAGLDYYWAKEAVLNSSLAELEGDGSGWGWNLGVMFRKDAWSLGASYRSASTVALDGTYSPLNQTLVMIEGLFPGQGLAPGQTAELDLNLPWRLQLGVRYAINPQLAVEVDWTRMGWSEFQKIEVQGKSTGQSIFTDTNDWEDADAIRVGLTYDVRPTTQLRLGYSYDETGQPDAHFSARVPDKDRQLFSIGVAQNLGNDITIEAGYMYVLTEDRDYVGVTPYAGQRDINGTTAINGNYKGDVNLFAIEVSKSF